MKPDITCCHHCQGTGSLPLTRGLQQTLDRLRNAKRPVSSFNLIEDGILQTAINNRLTSLEKLGFIERCAKQSKTYFWRVKKT